MNTTRLKGSWNIVKGKLRQRCARLIHDGTCYAKGREEELVGRLQRRHGKSRQEVERILAARHAAQHPAAAMRHD